MIRLIRLRAVIATLILSVVCALGALAQMGQVKSCSQNKGKVTVNSANGKTIIEFYSDDMVKITPIYKGCRLLPKASASVQLTPLKTKAVVKKDADRITVAHGNITVDIDRKTSQVSVYHNGVKKLSEKSISYSPDSTEYRFVNDKREALYGAGERGVGVDLQGDTLVMFNKQNYGYGKGDRTSQMNITMPYIASTAGYALFFDDYSNSRMVLGDDIEYLTRIPNPVGYVFIGSANGALSGIVENFTLLTGRQDLAPFWSLGYITSKYGYKTQEETEGVIDTLINEGYPVDGIVLDLYWYGQETDMGRFEWNPTQWPNHKAMLANLKKKGVKTVIISQPYLNKIGAIDNYNMAKDAGMLTTDDAGNVHDVTTWVGEAGMLDVSNPATREWLWSQYKRHTIDGVSGWWGDLGEPEVHPLTIRHHSGETAAEYHNRYGNDWSRIIYDGFKKEFPGTRLMTLMRGGTAGLQHYSVFPWSTDVGRSWGGLQAQIPIMINSALSGLGYMSHDVGGFAVDPANPVDAELYARWLEVGLFTPVLRTHSTVKAEPYHYTMPGYQDLFKRIIKARYAWLPYNYTLAYLNAATGAPFVRPLNYSCDNASLRDIQDQYLWGDNVMVAPVIEKGAFAREIIFPEGRWYDLNNKGQVFAGNSKVEYRAPLDIIPHFAREGAFIPRADYEMRNTGDYTTQRLTVAYYVAATKSEYSLFDDDRTSTNTIASGNYNLITFRATPAADALNIEISETKGGDNRDITLEVVGLDKAPAEVWAGDKKITDFTYCNGCKTLKFNIKHHSNTTLRIVK